MTERPFVSRAGAKLDHALDAFGFEVSGLRCADFGCNVGGFTDCLLQRGARGVVAIDTGYGVLAWKLRNDDRVEVRERTNALHADPPDEPLDLVVIDLAWTPQRLALPAARGWLAGTGHVISLVKPHYELGEDRRHLLEEGFLPQELAPEVLGETLETMGELGFEVLGSTQSPLVGGKSSRKRGVPGNIEYLVLLKPTTKV
ncbi:MAG: SAM-dependent methyltransferase [Planctomycetota bacterium]|nr:SAM-dependent methyltransferase [Planctomycetota bacterium]MEC9232740.1 SAM-dependent methyltransferase [Planctomycetota bacterium]MED5507125.1 SAM-dependent methyltransferase [Planctomycetota bacterium]MED6307329.1 SAM-dependent methyltransferase [Planctomycetota bacterium]